MSSSNENLTPHSKPTRSRGLVATFLSGLFAILPLVLTIAIVSWVAQKVLSVVGPDTQVGSGLRSLGLNFVTTPWVAELIGWATVLVGIWFLGLLVRTRLRTVFDRLIGLIMKRIPIVKGVYGTASQVFGMLERRDESELKNMSVVFCNFGVSHGAGFLCLLANAERFRFEDREYYIVYMPTSPLPMTGGIIFVPAESVRPVPMSVDKLMEIYFSMGILAPQAMPSGSSQPPRQD